MKYAPAAPTLEQLRRGTPWCWVVCEKCLQRRPIAFVPLIIRWGLTRRVICDTGSEAAARRQADRVQTIG